MSEIAVRAEGLSKRFKIYRGSGGRIAEALTFGKVKRHQEHWALKDISFEVPKGGALGVVGANGAGKSTLLKVISGVTQPTEGTFEINGRVGTLLELGGGFHPNFTGRMNVFMNAAIMGVPQEEVKRRFHEIAQFAELGDYLNRPVRTYSSGMTMRLGFAVAMLTRPDILILDEVFAVGDASFQKKCIQHMRELRKSGTSLLFVSHSIYHIRQMCDQAIWLNAGQMVTSGTPVAVTDEYVSYQQKLSANSRSKGAANEIIAKQGLPSLGEVVLRAKGEQTSRKTIEHGMVMDLHIEVRDLKGHGSCHVGVIVNRSDDTQAFSCRTLESGIDVSEARPRLVMRLPVDLLAGEFSASVFLLDEACEQVLDQRVDWVPFKVTYAGAEKGVFRVHPEWLTPPQAAKS